MPGAAHPPPYLAGREKEREIFQQLLTQDIILENIVLTGIRGIGKTVLLREFYKTDAIESGWMWAENDISESVSVSENQLLTRIFADLGVITGDWIVECREIQKIGFNAAPVMRELRADSGFWRVVAENTPGLSSDKLKKVLELAWRLMQGNAPEKRGIVFAYDEAQNFSDNAMREQYPLSLLLDVFSSLQRQKIPFMLALTGLPPLHSKLVEARTFAERMFSVVVLQNLDRKAAYDAILRPLPREDQETRKLFRQIETMLYNYTQGYPYFIQYWCWKLYDYFRSSGQSNVNIIREIQKSLDEDFFAGRWVQLSDRQRDILLAAARAIKQGTQEFSVQDVVEQSGKLPELQKPFSSSHANQMLTTLAQKGMVFKNRYGKYMFAVPMLDNYILRRHAPDTNN
ncbi:MAG: ATP-binding protein [Betaproteobacteria bacterium]|nr:ATP-binding protein [Betaproteobacteria bacterium]